MWPVIETTIVATNVDWFGVLLTLSTIVVTATAIYFSHRFFRHAVREM